MIRTQRPRSRKQIITARLKCPNERVSRYIGTSTTTVPLLRAIVRLLQQGITLPHATFAHTGRLNLFTTPLTFNLTMSVSMDVRGRHRREHV